MTDLRTLHTLIIEKKYEEALSLVAELEPREEGNKDFWYLKGVLYRWMDDYKSSIIFLEKSSTFTPTSKETYLALGISYQLDGQFVRAIEVLKKALDIDSHYLNAINSIGLSHRLNGDYEKAINAYQHALKLISQDIAEKMISDNDIQFFPEHPYVEAFWTSLAAKTALFVAIKLNYEAILWPASGEQAIELSKIKAFWEERTQEDGKKALLFLPNYYNCFFYALSHNKLYLTIVDNLGQVLMLNKQEIEAKLCLNEARIFNV
jgi:tetratricopeptide (TPR) repeat protein